MHHSTQAIIKPVQQLNKTNEAAQKEIEDAVNRVKEAQQSILTTVLNPEDAGTASTSLTLFTLNTQRENS